MIGIIDYGMGNLRSVVMGFARVGAEARIISTPREVATAGKLVLPGVGAFADAIANLRQRGLDAPIVQAIERGRPFLGICLGLQLLFDVSYEDGEHTGLGVLPGKVVRFNFDDLPAASRPSIPHMGWNQVEYTGRVALLDGVPSGSYVYFVHSYYVAPMTDSVTQLTTDYGRRFVSGVARDNLLATQFHPEKSQAVGLRILENFAKM
ncbi:MAG: imidazole glycerol phosphate synthase subunit HisH [Phycisphaerae bacterium]|nr:imidazole glycerol phosphate synthase subunit HisH [Phycisphaerae bacterium]